MCWWQLNSVSASFHGAGGRRFVIGTNGFAIDAQSVETMLYRQREWHDTPEPGDTGDAIPWTQGTPRKRQDVSALAARRGLFPRARYGNSSRMKDARVPAGDKDRPAAWPSGRSFTFGQAELAISTITLSCKVRPAAKAWLDQASREVNTVWNFCNATTFKAWHGRYGGTRRWLSAYDVNPLLAGCGETFDRIGIDVAQCVAAEHAMHRQQYKRSKLRWRKSGGSRKSPGWIPFKAPNLRFKTDKKDSSRIKVGFLGKSIGLFQAERLLSVVRLARQGVGKVRAGSFSQDALGDWYLNVCVDRAELRLAPVFGSESSIGLDPGFKASLTGSDGSSLGTGSYRGLEQEIAQAQRRGHKKHAKRLHRTARRRRAEARNQFCRAVVNTYARIWVGNLDPQRMARSELRGHAKSVHDAAFGAAFHTLEAMGRRAGRVVEKVSECNSTRRCSACQALTGPAGLGACVVRQWACGACRASHDRDVNAGENLRQAGEWGWKTRWPRDCDRAAAPRCGRPFAGTR